MRYATVQERKARHGDRSRQAAGTRNDQGVRVQGEVLKLMDEVAETGEEIIITKNGKPVAKLSAHREKPKSLYGMDKGRMKIIGDIISPIDVEWGARNIM